MKNLLRNEIFELGTADSTHFHKAPWKEIAASAYRTFLANLGQNIWALGVFRDNAKPAFEELPNEIQIAFEAAVRHTVSITDIAASDTLAKAKGSIIVDVSGFENNWIGWKPPVEYKKPYDAVLWNIISQRVNGEKDSEVWRDEVDAIYIATCQRLCITKIWLVEE